MPIIGIPVGATSYREETQAAHGFSVGQVIRHNGTDYVLAQADVPANAENVVGIVSAVPNVNTFRFTLPGFAFGSGYTPGASYYLSAATAGATATVAPNITGTVVVPLGVGLEDGSLMTQGYSGFQTV
jgi:hypothetical protein